MKHLRLNGAATKYGIWQQSLNKILDILIEFCYLAIVFFVPIFFAAFLNNNDVFELNKIVLFKILILLLLLFSLFKLALPDDKYKIRRWLSLSFFYKYLLIPCLFLLSLLITVIFSRDPAISFYGLYSRYQGLDSYIFYFLFFILLLSNIKTIKQIRRIIIAAVLSSFLVSLYGLAQMAGFDFKDWTEPAFITGRATSTLGQPNFLASYLLLVIPLTIYLIIRTSKFLIRFLWIIVFLFQILSLFFTYSRGGWIGLILGITLTGLIYLWITKKNVLSFLKNKKLIKFSLLILFLLVVYTTCLLCRSDFFRYRIKSSFDFKGGSVAARINFWQAGWQAFKKNPILGYGPETQGEVFVGYYKKDWAIHGNVNVYPNRAHNLFFDILLTSGLVGLILYLALLYLFYKLILANIKNKQRAGLSVAVFLAVTGYLISLMFNFSIVATNVYFWLFLAIVILIHNNLDKPDDLENKEIKKPRQLTKLIALILIIVLSLLVLRQINKEIKYIIADHYYYEFKESLARNESFNALEMYNYIDELNIYSAYYKKEMAVGLAEKLNDIPFPILKEEIKKILAGELEDVKINNYGNMFAQAKIYTALAADGQKDYFSLAEENFKKLIDLSPEMPRNYYELARIYAEKEEFNRAEEYFDKALEMLPDINNPYINGQHLRAIEYEKYLIYKGLAGLYFRQENYEEAEKYFWLALYNNLPDITMYKKIADTYYKQGNLDKAIWYNKKGMIMNPADYVWPFAIALLYEKQGNKDKAPEYAEKALKLAPDNEDIKNFINTNYE